MKAEKERRTKAELEALVLAELHGQPQCADVRHVTVVAHDDYRLPATWEVASFNPGTSDQVECERTLIDIISRLQKHFDISQ
jgi:hypothetical protein